LGIILGAVFRIPVIIHVRGSDLHTYGLKNRFLRILTHFILVHANRILCTSTKSCRDILEKFSNIPEKKIEVVYNEVDTALFHPMAEQTARKELRLEPVGIHFVFIGNIRQEKGVDALLSVMKKIFSTCQERLFCHFVGNGVLASGMMQETYQAGLSEGIKFYGAVAHEQIPLWMNAANALILPSRREGMPNVVLEALACGIPVIASDAGDVKTFIKNGMNGFILKGEIEAELKHRLTKILSEPELLIKMKKNLQCLVVKKQSVPDGNNKLTDIYDSLLREKGRREPI
jgi:glycosyltransferase involved in cell wall biosynthesis